MTSAENLATNLFEGVYQFLNCVLHVWREWKIQRLQQNRKKKTSELFCVVHGEPHLCEIVFQRQTSVVTSSDLAPDSDWSHTGSFHIMPEISVSPQQKFLNTEGLTQLIAAPFRWTKSFLPKKLFFVYCAMLSCFLCVFVKVFVMMC